MKMNEESIDKVEAGVELTDEALEGVAGGDFEYRYVINRCGKCGKQRESCRCGLISFPNI